MSTNCLILGKEKRLKEILGQDKAEKLLKKIDIKNEENDMSRIISLIGLLQFS
jgi:hypothetical protein